MLQHSIFCDTAWKEQASKNLHVLTYGFGLCKFSDVVVARKRMMDTGIIGI